MVMTKAKIEALNEKYRKNLLARKRAEARKREAEERKQRSKERMLEKKLEAKEKQRQRTEKLKAEKLELQVKREKERRSKRRMQKFDKVSKTIRGNLQKAFAPQKTNNSMLKHQERMMRLRLKQMKQQERLMRMASQSPQDHLNRGIPDSEDQWLSAPDFPSSAPEFSQSVDDVPVRRGNPLSRLMGRLSFLNSAPQGAGFSSSNGNMTDLSRQDIRMLDGQGSIASGQSSILASNIGINDPSRNWDTGRLMKRQPQQVPENVFRTRKQKLNFW